MLLLLLTTIKWYKGELTGLQQGVEKSGLKIRDNHWYKLLLVPNEFFFQHSSLNSVFCQDFYKLIHKLARFLQASCRNLETSEKDSQNHTVWVRPSLCFNSPLVNSPCDQYKDREEAESDKCLPYVNHTGRDPLQNYEQPQVSPDWEHTREHKHAELLNLK